MRAVIVAPGPETLLTLRSLVLVASFASLCVCMGDAAAAALMSTTCSTVDCASNSLPPAGRGLQQCRHCFRTYCRGCMNAGDMRILEYRWLTPQAVCLKCFGRLSRIESTLHELAVLRGTWPCSDRTVQSPPPSPCCFLPFVHANT